MGRLSYREHIVRSGVTTVRQRGFATVGVREITAAAGVAQGSFTNHFASKEEFGLAVLNEYFAQYSRMTAETVGDRSRPPMERLHAYFDAATEYFSAAGWRYGCLAGNMALEASEHSEMIRKRLAELFPQWAQPFAQAIREAQATGEVRGDVDADDAAAALLEAWQGAMLRMKIDRTPAALGRFKEFVLPRLLPGPVRSPVAPKMRSKRKQKG